MMTNLLIGYAIVLAGWLLIDTGLKALLANDGETAFGVWNEVKCVEQPEAEWTGRPTATGANLAAFSGADVLASVAGISAAGGTVAMVEAAARAAGITDPNQIKIYTALIMQESSMCTNKVGPATRYGTAYGCGQMLLSTAQGLDPAATASRLRDDDAYNLSLSARYFSQQLSRYGGDIRRTLASYNGGDKANEASTNCPGQMAWECTMNSGYAQTRHYVSNIMLVAGGL